MPTHPTMDLFPKSDRKLLERHAPLADRMRPQAFEEMIGQEKLTEKDTALRSLLEAGTIPSTILWGPPGSGKTTLAWLLGDAPEARMEALSAATGGVKEIREAVEAARRTPLRTLLFIDEIHRLSRSQQDVLLPHVEAGTVTLIGATTENPSFTLNSPLLSRCTVLSLEPLTPDALERVIDRAWQDPDRGLGQKPSRLPEDSRHAVIEHAAGDARKALGLLEAASALHLSSPDRNKPLAPETIRQASGTKMLLYDRDREEHYNVVSAFIKSLRASDPDAAVYYLARMLEGGEDPLFIARRLLIFASEDIGNADPSALGLALAAHQAVERLGLPEGRIPLAQATTFLACALKSNAAYQALELAQERVRATGSLPVPLHLRNAPTALLRQRGYGADYVYPHDEAEAWSDQWNLPDAMGEPDFYRPSQRGVESDLAARLARWRQIRLAAREKS